MKLMRLLNTAVLLFTLSAISNLAYAHAVVTHSSLDLAPVPVNQASLVQLTFNSRVELDLSQVFLVSAGDQMQAIEADNGNEPGKVILHLPALAPGEYAIKLKIFAADGHLSEDLLRFFVGSQKK